LFEKLGVVVARTLIEQRQRSVQHMLLPPNICDLTAAVHRRATSEMGQSRRYERAQITSGLPLKADISRAGRHVSKVPKAEVQCQLAAPAIY
jgi:hypothetical protein